VDRRVVDEVVDDAAQTVRPPVAGHLPRAVGGDNRVRVAGLCAANGGVDESDMNHYKVSVSTAKAGGYKPYKYKKIVD
jgi:hypothetical protein